MPKVPSSESIGNRQTDKQTDRQTFEFYNIRFMFVIIQVSKLMVEITVEKNFSIYYRKLISTD